MAVGGVGSGVPFRSLGIASSGLSAQRARIETIATNIANATAVGADGTPYRRRVVALQEVGLDPAAAVRGNPGRPQDPGVVPGGVSVAEIREVDSPGTPVYEPGHPRADENGYVLMPDVSITDEMVALMDARRLYDANATVFEAVKGMLRRAAQI